MRNQSCIKAWEVNVAKAIKKALPFSALREDQRDAFFRREAEIALAQPRRSAVLPVLEKALPFSALREDQRDAARRAPAQERTAEEAVQDDLEQMRQKLEDKTHGS